VGDANHLVVRHADRLGQLAEDVAGRRAGATEDVHVEVDVDGLRVDVGVMELLAQPLDPQLGPHLPHGVEVGAVLHELPDGLLDLEHAALADLDQVPHRDVLVEPVHLPLPVPAPGDPRVHGQPVERPRVPVRVEADAADVALRPLRDGLRDRVGPQRRVLPDDDREGAGVERLVHLLLDGGLRPEDVLGGRLVEHLGRDVRIPEIYELEVLEHVEVEVLDVAGGVPDGLLPDPLRSRDPLGLRHPGVLLPARDVRRADDRHVGPLEVSGRRGERLAHERRLVAVDHREVAGPDMDPVADRVP